MLQRILRPLLGVVPGADRMSEGADALGELVVGGDDDLLGVVLPFDVDDGLVGRGRREDAVEPQPAGASPELVAVGVGVLHSERELCGHTLVGGQQRIAAHDHVPVPFVPEYRARHLQVDSSDHEYSDTVPEGHVISQSPVGTVLHRGDTVSLVVSKGPELVQIPDDLRGMAEHDAVAQLEGLGFHVKPEKTEFYVGLHVVVGSDPDPGSYARKGSTIVIKIV